MLKDWTLEFRYYLTIKKEKGAVVPLGIFEIDEGDERNLDRYEGYPTHYRKEVLSVFLDGKEIEAIVYIMNEEVKDVMPLDYFYMKTCLEGYRDFNFDTKYLYEAYKKSLGQFLNNQF